MPQKIMYAIRISTFVKPPISVATVPDAPSDRIPFSASDGRTMNSPTLSSTASTIATPMTTLSMLLPSFAASHFSNFVGSSSSVPSIFADVSNVVMPIASMLTMLTAPRMMGSPIHLCFLLSGSDFL